MSSNPLRQPETGDAPLAPRASAETSKIATYSMKGKGVAIQNNNALNERDLYGSQSLFHKTPLGVLCIASTHRFKSNRGCRGWRCPPSHTRQPNPPETGDAPLHTHANPTHPRLAMPPFTHTPTQPTRDWRCRPRPYHVGPMIPCHSAAD